jgi:hypothetical protein
MIRPVFSLTTFVVATSVHAAMPQQIESNLEPKTAVNLEVIESVASLSEALTAVDSTRFSDAGSTQVDTEAGVAVRAAQGRVSLSERNITADGTVQYIVSLIDENSGIPIELKESNFLVTDRWGRPSEFTLESFEEAEFPASVAILVDSSGSMDSVMDEVIFEAQTLFDKLPDHIECQAVVFADKHTSYGRPGAPCHSSAIDLSGIVADGGTNIFGALKSVFVSMNTHTHHNEKFVLVLTDGAPSDFNDELFSEVLSLKGETQVLFFWLGSKSADAELIFEPLADHFVDDPQGAWRYLDQYFGAFSNRMNSQVVLSITTAKPALVRP